MTCELLRAVGVGAIKRNWEIFDCHTSIYFLTWYLELIRFLALRPGLNFSHALIT